LESAQPRGSLLAMTDDTPQHPPRDDPLEPAGDAPRHDEPADDAPGDDEPTVRMEQPRRLTRSGSDAIIGGVAGGLGRYFNTDPILFRIGFVALSFAGGIGLIAYLALLAFVPSDGEQGGSSGGRIAATAGAIVLGLAVVLFLGTPFFFLGPGLLVIALVGLAGVLLWRAFGGESGGDPTRTIARIAIAALVAFVVAGAAIGVGIAAALGGGVVIASLAVVTGLVLIATAFFGGVRWLIIPALALVLPLGVVAAADIDFDGGVGDRYYRPASVNDLRDSYELGIGELDLDLREVDLPAGRTDVVLDVGMGEAVVWVPDDACVTSDVAIGVGAADVFDRDQSGVDLEVEDSATARAGQSEVHINADIGIGAIEVVREGFLRDGFDRDGFGERFRYDGELDGFEGTNCT
jgi:phage shock protein PspC (stress-responsive transcriptional regulator)